ncbi:hypothetical protein K491DRAFT_780573 [Lophiostoma macrostomum CBS 122681]|uniref:Uncharacterized protein n=1 Tax=Lophiostoma macrostomum CBS 122681 TaxID=1314788 RepID=A0A6A6T1E2_9PLEO|nr:hypothetical protein K491DRAFT_780573 [Lophiostoma macrostomum CBS 122681]
MRGDSGGIQPPVSPRPIRPSSNDAGISSPSQQVHRDVGREPANDTKTYWLTNDLNRARGDAVDLNSVAQHVTFGYSTHQDVIWTLPTLGQQPLSFERATISTYRHPVESLDTDLSPFTSNYPAPIGTASEGFVSAQGEVVRQHHRQDVCDPPLWEGDLTSNAIINDHDHTTTDKDDLSIPSDCESKRSISDLRPNRSICLGGIAALKDTMHGTSYTST